MHTVQKEDEVELVWQNPPAIVDEMVSKWIGIRSHCKSLRHNPVNQTNSLAEYED